MSAGVPTTAAEGIYLFCLARRGALPPLEEPGLEGRPVTAWAFREIAALGQPLPIEAFAGPEAEEHLQDLAWVGPRACRHEELVERAMQFSPVLPARFGTLFSSLESLKALVDNHCEAILRFLEYAADKEEWAVKGLLDREEAQRHFLAAAGVLPSSPGTRYLMEQRHRAQAAREVKSWVSQISLTLAARLERQAVDFRPLRPLARQTSGREQEMVFNWAFFVARRDREAFRLQVEELSAAQASQGLVLELSGPWPPYHFCPSLAAAPGQGEWP